MRLVYQVASSLVWFVVVIIIITSFVFFFHEGGLCGYVRGNAGEKGEFSIMQADLYFWNRHPDCPGDILLYLYLLINPRERIIDYELAGYY